MASVGSLSVDLIANTASFNSNIEKAAANLNSSASKMSNALKSVQSAVEGVNHKLQLLGEAFAIRETAEAIKGSLEFAASMKKQADVIGLTAEQLQLYHLAGQRVGASQEDVDGGLKKLTVSMGKAELGAKKQQDAFNALGVDYRKTAGEAIPQLATALSKVGDDSKRHALEVLTMGRAAVQLDPLFKQGAAGIAKFGDEAEKAGLILSNEFAEKAHEADIKLDELITTLKIDFSKEVIQNADAIIALANALAHVTGAAISFINTYPKLSGALAGAAAGALRGGLPGAIIGGGAGLALGALGERGAANSNTDLGFRQRALADALTELHNRQSAQTGGGLFTLRHSNQDGGNLQSQVKEVERQTALLRNATTLFRQAHAPAVKLGDDIPDILAPKGPKGHKARVKKDPLQDADLKFNEELAQIDEQILQVKKAGLTNLDDIAAIDIQLLAKESIAKDSAIQKEVRDKHITEVQGDKLIQEEAILVAAKAEAITRRLAGDKLKDQVDLQNAANDNEKELLNIQEQLAVTTADKRAIALRILDLDKEEEIRKNKTIIALNAIGQATDKEAADARQRLAALPAIYDAKAAQVKDSTLSPLDQYVKDNDPALLKDKVEQLEVTELESVRQGIDDAISNALGIQDPFLKGLIDLFIRQVLIDPIAKALQGASAGGGGGGLGGILSGIGSIFGGGGGGFDAAGAISDGMSIVDSLPVIGAFASGTTNAPPGTAWVGENGPELLKFRGGESVFNLPQLRGMAANNNSGDIHIGAINVNGGMSAREARETGAQMLRGIRQEQAKQMRMGA